MNSWTNHLQALVGSRRAGLRLVGTAAVLGLGWLAACTPDTQLIGDAVPNTRPDTHVTGTPPVLTETGFEVSFFWTGSDEDGEVVGYEWRISDNGEDQMIDPEDTLEVDLPWSHTTVTDSTFAVSADLDSFPTDVGDPNQGPRNYRFWQSHTFFVRSIDDQGARDRTPANVSFTATTIAPRVIIDLPTYVPATSCRSSAKVLTFGWTGSDADNVTDEPTHIRYLLIPAENPSNQNCWARVEYEAQIPPLITPDDPAWSPWIEYNAPQDSGRVVTLPRQEAGKRFLFAVQARDVAGAVTPTFDWGVNVRHVQTTDGKTPKLTATEQFLGTKQWSGRFGTIGFEVVSGQPLAFTWVADAIDYAGIIEAFRYGWDIVDPDDPNDPGWAVPWGNGPNWRRSPERSFSQGTHNFVVQCRDNSGTISRGFYNLQVIQIARLPDQRPLLLVDDWKNGNTTGGQQLDLAWDLEWSDILTGRVQGFQPGDVLDAESQTARMTFRTINEYRAIIWFTSGNTGSFFHSRLAPGSNTSQVYNWLEIYQARVGNLLFVGPGAMTNAVESGEWIYPHVYNTSTPPWLGFGTRRLADGTLVNRGISRWPYTGWCLEMTDLVRPAIGFAFGEHDQVGVITRTQQCDTLIRAVLDPNFITRFPDAGPPANVRTLEPNDRRKDRSSIFQFTVEEIYNQNITRRELSLVVRNCQVPMFRFQARRDDPVVEYVAFADSLCKPPWSPTSKLDNAPIAVASSVYSNTKQQRGARDFLWGFHPLAFQRSDVEASLFWILKFNWDLPVQ